MDSCTLVAECCRVRLIQSCWHNRAVFTTILLQTLISMGVAIPAAPGFFGVFEKLAVAGLAIYLVPRDLATSWAIGFRILSFIPITVIGAYYFIRMGFNLKEIQAA